MSEHSLEEELYWEEKMYKMREHFDEQKRCIKKLRERELNEQCCGRSSSSRMRKPQRVVVIK